MTATFCKNWRTEEAVSREETNVTWRFAYKINFRLETSSIKQTHFVEAKFYIYMAFVKKVYIAYIVACRLKSLNS
jgi:hypothetical protein